MLRSLLFFVLVCHVASPVPLDEYSRTPEVCGYESCPQVNHDVLNVHIVPHTHDDVGWLKTVDQYYYGSRNNIQKAGVQYILDSVVRELWENPKRRFIYVETAFFWKWWSSQPEDIKLKVHTLVRQGRLEFIGGAWSMNDEAASHYQSTIDQFTFGLRKLNDTFGECGRPRVGWQIDPFGHSREFASLLAAMKYDGLFLGRIDYQDKRTRMINKTMEMVWRGNDDLGKQSDIFTGVLFNTYSPPRGFCFDVLCDDEPIIDDVHSPMYNLDARVAEFIAISKNMSKAYQTSNVLVTMGEDFQYQDARMWYKNLDLLIQHVNLKAAKDGLKIKLYYSTPSCYLKAVKDSDPVLPTKQDDFFPYASDPTAYWTGYFTSRPTTKYFERQANGYLQTVKQLQVLADLRVHNEFSLHELSAAMGIMQHHDAITGTEKQHVAHDYERILTEAVDDALGTVREAFNKISQGDALKPPVLTYDRCQLNQSQCATSEDRDEFVLTIYNALGWPVTAPIRIPVRDGPYVVHGPDGKAIKTQEQRLAKKILQIPTRKSKATHELVFIAEDLPPVGFRQYYVQRTTADRVRRHVPFEPDNETNKQYSEFYSNIDQYWQHLKEKSLADVGNLEALGETPEAVPKGASRGSSRNVPAKLNEKRYEPIDTKTYLDPAIKIMRDSNSQGINEDILQLEMIIEEAKRKAVGDDLDPDDRQSESRKAEKTFSPFSGEELRMISDDPFSNQFTDVYRNQHFTLKTDAMTGDVVEVVLRDGTIIKLSSALMYYKGCVGDNSDPSERSSGAYIFRPNGTKSVEAPRIGLAKITKGEVFDQLEFKFTVGTLTYTIYKHPSLDKIFMKWVVSIDVKDHVGKEIVVLYKTDIINNGEFYTDSNGRQMVKRKLNQRPQWNVSLEEPVPGNYYPITNKIAIEDEKKTFVVITDRSEGGSSLQEGQVELMVHRRLLHDDAFGVDEALNETAFDKPLVAIGEHVLLINPTSKHNAIKERLYTFEQHLQPQIFVSNAEKLGYQKWLKLKNEYSGIENSLPVGVHLLTLEPWKEGSLLLRLENYLEKKDQLNTDVVVDVRDLFAGLKLIAIKETNLVANQWAEDSVTWEWRLQDKFKASFNDAYGSFSSVPDAAADEDIEIEPPKVFSVELAAKQIKTFVVQYQIEKAY